MIESGVLNLDALHFRTFPLAHLEQPVENADLNFISS
jgi:hypothetical protein